MTERPISAVLGHWPTEAIAKAASRHGAPSEVRIGAAVRALMNAGYAMTPVSAEHTRTIEEAQATGRQCLVHGTQQVEAGSPVAALEWFEAAAAAFRAAGELERSISGGMET